jgi:uncharacterized protein (DUF342 family)
VSTHTDPTRVNAADPSHCLVNGADGVVADPDALGAPLVAAVDALYRSGMILAGVDYPVLLRALYGHGPALPRGADGQTVVRLAADIRPFDPARRALYRAVKIARGQAEYYIEPVWLSDPADPEGPGVPTQLDIDEFIADMWLKGIRCGIDVGTVRAAIASGKGERVTAAAHIEPVPGLDAAVDEVSDDIHRNNAPRRLPDGRYDLHSFQNRFPQVQEGARLLRKIPATRGVPGVEMSGLRIAPEDGKDLDLGAYCGPGTRIDRCREGEFVVAQQTGFLSVDGATSRLSVGDKIVSHDGVSARTTGNLQLTGDYEEFGEVQELRTIEGESITVHADVFGRLVSRGGTVLLHANLVGGSVLNRRGDIRVLGVASGATLQALEGTVELERAENCIVSGTRVRINHAVNCEIIGDEVEIGVAEGSAVAGRRVSIETAAPRKQVEMLVCVLQPEGPKVAEVIAAVGKRLQGFTDLIARHQTEMARVADQPELRRFLLLRTKVQKGEVRLSPDQARLFQRMAQEVAAGLKQLADLGTALKAAQAERQSGEALLARLEEQRRDAAGGASVAVASVQGDVQVRMLGFSPAAGKPYHLGHRDIKARLRGAQTGELLFAGAAGSVAWSGVEEAEAA